jgi:hypothetical protein
MGVEDFHPNDIRIRVPAAANLDDASEPVRLDPGSGGAKNEGFGFRAVSVAVHVPPDTQEGSAKRGELARGRGGERTPFGKRKQGWEGPQHGPRLTVVDRQLSAPCPFEAVRRPRVHRLSHGC